MPTYPYRCQKCSTEFEVEQKITEPPVTRCEDPSCDGTPERQIASTGFVLNGSGWYRDGYASRR